MYPITGDNFDYKGKVPGLEQVQDWFSNPISLRFGSLNVLINQKSKKTEATVTERVNSNGLLKFVHYPLSPSLMPYYLQFHTTKLPE